jgi:hypothetical protein
LKPLAGAPFAQWEGGVSPEFPAPETLMASPTRRLVAVPTRTLRFTAATPSRGVLLVSGLMTMIALVPLAAVLGYVIAVKLGRDPSLFVLCGALLGALYSLWKRNR